MGKSLETNILSAIDDFPLSPEAKTAVLLVITGAITGSVAKSINLIFPTTAPTTEA